MIVIVYGTHCKKTLGCSMPNLLETGSILKFEDVEYIVQNAYYIECDESKNIQFGEMFVTKKE